MAEFLSQSHLWKSFVKYFCSPTIVHRKFCTDILFAVTGFDAAQANYVSILLFHNNKNVFRYVKNTFSCHISFQIGMCVDRRIFL